MPSDCTDTPTLPLPAEELLRRVVRTSARRHVKRRAASRGFFWGTISDDFAIGSTYAVRIARFCGVDPDSGTLLD